MRAVTPADVRFAPPGAPARAAARCPGCGAVAAPVPVLEVPALHEGGETLALGRCPACGTLAFDPPGVHDFSTFGATGDAFWRHYVEAGGGVWETVWPILVARGAGTLLDVGCGFGFSLDFWRRSGRGEAVGVELAAYGRAGAAKLGVTIHERLLGECPAVDGRRFDLVYASEVVEHVADPRAFVATLAGYVAADGVLAMTTPAASYVVPDHRGPTQLAALAPGFHGFLLSARAFEDAARAAGFDHVVVEVQSERQFLWASRRPLALDRRLEAHREALLAYLDARLAEPALDPIVRRGFRYRLLRDLANLGRWPEAERAHAALVAELVRDFGPAVLDVEVTPDRLARCDSLEAFGAIAPYFIVNVHHLTATMLRARGGDAVLALAHLDAAERIGLACARIGTSYFLEAIDAIWPARIERASILLAAGVDEAAADLARAADEGDRLDDRHGFATVAPSRLDAWLPAAADFLARAGRAEAATVVAEAYARHLARRRGGAVRAPASRNDRCPCGSGRRYKACHGRVDGAAA